MGEKVKMNKYDCECSCPKCGGKVELFGSDCYPDDGVIAECMNPECTYVLKVRCSIRTDALLDTVRNAHNFLYKFNKERE